MFFYYKRHGMSFHSSEKQICLNLSAVLKFAKTQNEPKRAEMKKCDPQSATTIQDQFFLTIFTKRLSFAILLLMGGFYYLGISKMSLTFQVSTRVQVSVSIKTARKANICLHTQYCRLLEVTFQCFWI